jgi:prephenate dehydratase
MAKRIAYLGPAGTFTEEAFLRHTAGQPGIEPVPCATLAEIVDLVEAGKADQGVAPIENSIAGAINDVIDGLVNAKNARIIGELLLPVDICLIVAPGTDLSKVTAVRSKAEALGQCRKFLSQRMPNAKLEPYDSTVRAVQSLAGAGGSSAALGPKRAAELTGMEVVEVGVQDRQNNITRFAIIGRGETPRTGRDKTSIIFDFDREDAPGLVYAALKPFADRGINLAKIESRPTGAKIGVYYFLLDFDGHIEDANVKEALAELTRHTAMCKTLGSYPRAKLPA